jgi:hypothetical protein
VKELALRKVCGASGKSLLVLLSVEFILTLLLALLLGTGFIKIFLSTFQVLSDIQMSLSNIYLESLTYIGAIILCALSAFILLLALFRKRTINASIRRSNKNIFRNMSIVIQLIISIGFVFCSVVMVKQIYFLHHTDMGFDYKNTYSIQIWPNQDMEVLENQIKQMPEITETMVTEFPILPVTFMFSAPVSEWEKKSAETEELVMDVVFAPEKTVRFFNLRLLEGELFSDGDPANVVLIGESAAKAFGWDNPVGKTFGKDNHYKVKGVVKDIYRNSPSITYKPMYFVSSSFIAHESMKRAGPILVFRC